MGFSKIYAEKMYGVKGFWKKVFCGHRGWRELPINDWRTDEKYYQCRYCGCIRNYGFRDAPVNFDLSSYDFYGDVK